LSSFWDFWYEAGWSTTFFPRFKTVRVLDLPDSPQLTIFNSGIYWT